MERDLIYHIVGAVSLRLRAGGTPDADDVRSSACMAGRLLLSFSLWKSGATRFVVETASRERSNAQLSPKHRIRDALCGARGIRR